MSEEVLVKFVGNTKDLDNKVKSVDKSLSAVANGVKKAFQVSAVAIGATATAIGVLVKQSADAYAEFEQLEGGLESLFGKGSENMTRVLVKSEEAWQKLTMSQNDYLTAFQSAYPLVNAGLSENADSIEYTNKMLQISSDLFNTYGGNVEQYQNAINWALKGSFVYLDNLNLGIKGTQEGFIEAANASGVLGRQIEKVSELTSDEIIDVIQHYAEAYGVWGKTGQEAATTIQGSLKMTKATWNNLIAGFSKDGADMNKLIDNFINSAMKFGENLLPVIERALTSITNALPNLISKINEMLPTLLQNLLPPLIQGAVELISGLAKALPSIIPILMNALVDATKQLSAVLPDITRAVIEGTVLIIQALAEQLPELIPVIVDGILEIIPILIENIPLFLSVGGMLLEGLLKGLINSIPKLLAKIPGFVNSMFNKFKEGIGSFVSLGGDLIKGLWNGMSGLKDWVVNKVKNMGKSILNSIKNVLGIHSPSTEFAMVGKFSVLGYTEALDSMTKDVQGQIAETFGISPQMENSSALHYSPSVNVTTINNIEQDPLGRLVNNIKTFSGGAKNDYNYGTGVS